MSAMITAAVVGAVGANAAAKKASKASQGASDAAALQAQIGEEQWERYKELYSPLETAYVNEAQNYDSPERYAMAAGDASATVASQFGKARDRLSRTPGLDPSTPGFAASMIGLDLAQAASDATAQNAARMRVGDTAWARRSDALSLGKGLPASASSMLSNSASTMSSIANNQYNLANSQAGAIGRVFERVATPASNWLNNSGRAAFSQTDLGSSGFGTGLAYGNQDYGLYLGG